MSSLVQVSDAVNLAFHAMSELARRAPSPLRIRDLAKQLQGSEAHLAKVMQRLRQVGLVVAVRGPAGGYRLARPAESISLLAVFEAIDGPLVPRSCLFAAPVCSTRSCGLGMVFGDLNRQLRDLLATTSLATVPGETMSVAGLRSLLDPGAPGSTSKVTRTSEVGVADPVV